MIWYLPVLEIRASLPVRSWQLWRRTGNFSLIFLYLYVYTLKLKAGGPTTFWLSLKHWYLPYSHWSSVMIWIMAGCEQGTSHHLNQWWPSYVTSHSITREQWVNSLRPRQNGRLFADDTFKRIFLKKNIRISTKNSLKFVPNGLINNIPALVLIMAWHRPGDKLLSEPMLVRSLTHICVTRPQWVKEFIFHHSEGKLVNSSRAGAGIFLEN